MKRLRVYTDTSVIGGCFDPEFAEHSLRLFEAFKTGNLLAVISDLTLNELLGAPGQVRNHLQTLPEQMIEYISFDSEAGTLAQQYIAEGVLLDRQLVDAQHIAVATVKRVDVIVSWNFKHVVNLQKIRGFNAVNLREGYPLVEIRTPREVIQDEN
jgi:hypothetical protein